MRTDNMIQSLRILVKADAIIAEATLKSRLTQIAIQGMAFCACVFGLAMTGIAAFFELREVWGPIWAALAVGVSSLAFAMLLVLVSVYRKPPNDIQIARDMHKMALDSLLREGQLAASDFVGVRGAIRNAASETLVGMLVPLAALLLRTLRRSRDEKPKEE